MKKLMTLLFVGLLVSTSALWSMEKPEAIDSTGNIETEENCDYTALKLAAFHDHADVVKFLLEVGADVNAEDGDGKTPLVLAPVYENEDLGNNLIDLDDLPDEGDLYDD